MTDYDCQYQAEESLFGVAYKEFEDFIKKHALKGGKALDLGCGQGRDALMLAQYGYAVTGVDSSEVGIAQMVERAKARNLAVLGVVNDLYAYEPTDQVNAVVLDSILHFTPRDTAKELALLDKVLLWLNNDGYLFVFVHKSPQKEKVLKRWAAGVESELTLIKDGYIDYTYEEKTSGFKSDFQYYMFIGQRCAL